jgi:hypothetical protein
MHFSLALAQKQAYPKFTHYEHDVNQEFIMLRTISCPHCDTSRQVRFEGEGGACGYYDDQDAKCPTCGKWDDEPVEDTND